MDPFEKMKEEWKSQKYESDIDLESIRRQTKNELFSHQRKLIFTNLFVSVAFALVFIVLGWIWNSFPDRTPYFYVGLASMGILLLATLAGFWAGVHYKKENSYKDTNKYLKDRIKKLSIRKFMIQRFVPIYLVLLLFCLFMYFADILANASAGYIFAAYGGTTLYIIIVYLVSRKMRQRKLKEIDELTEELRKWSNEFQ